MRNSFAMSVIFSILSLVTVPVGIKVIHQKKSNDPNIDLKCLDCLQKRNILPVPCDICCRKDSTSH